MAVDKRLRVWLLVWGFLAFFAKSKIDQKFTWPYPSVDSLVVTENYTTDLSAVFLGAHRLAADIAYVQFLQYYGVNGHEETEMDADKEGVAQSYPRLFEFGRRLIRLDPYFNKAILEVAGSVAFNQYRITEALELLKEAMVLDPHFFRYRLYAAAILYQNEGQDEKVIGALAEAVRYPDAPYMLKNILANLYKKKGRYLESAQMRIFMMQTAPTEGDRAFAERKLLLLLQEHPEIRGPLTHNP